GMTLFDAVNHSMSTIATGGFSTHDESAAYFHSPAIEWCMILFMLLCGLDFGMYIGMLRDGVKAALENVEMRFFLVMLAVSSFILAAELLTSGMNVGEAVRTAIFQSTTVASTTGFVSADFDQWPPLSKMCLLFMMAVGGCSGSTAGGIKVIRILLVAKLVGLGGRRAMSPSAREEIQLGGRTVSREVLFGAGYFLFAYCALVCLWSMIFTWDGSSAFDSIALAVTTMGNVGPGFGEWGATCNYAALPTLSKVTVAASMLIGRLEIFPMLALFRPGFWNKERGWD
ncbi:MAG: TrkH family potassium uptake protein, partial [Schwartzia sp.]|nr:TrkH family potassium uptake protein [Schwartzia sp. (in: firmicutes)]